MEQTRAPLLLALALLSLLACLAAPLEEIDIPVLGIEKESIPRQSTEATARLFNAVDNNGDGQIEAKEAAEYVAAVLKGDELFDTTEEVDAAVAGMITGLDGSDKGSTISLDEFADHAATLLQGNRPVDWVRHGLQLPQYADNFRQNAITVSDFPLLAGAEGAAILKTDLQVSSKLHREKIARSVKRLMLGIGHPPSAPEAVTCVVVNCTTIALDWSPPSDRGSPPLHKYVVERRIRLQDGWRTVAEPDEDDTQFVYSELKDGQYEFRIVAWSLVGRSSYGLSDPCGIDTHVCPTGKRGPFNAEQPDPSNTSDTGSKQGAGSSSSFWLTCNTVLTVCIYSASIFLKSNDEGMRASTRKAVGGFVAVRAVARMAGRLDHLDVWINKPDRPERSHQRYQRRVTSPFPSTSQPDSPVAGSLSGKSRAASAAAVAADDASPAPADDAEQRGESPPLSPSLYPEGFPLELVAPFGGSPHRGDLPHSASMGALIGDGSSAEGRPGLGEDDDLDSNPSVRRAKGMENRLQKSSSGPRLSQAWRSGSESVRLTEMHMEHETGQAAAGGPEQRHRCAHPGCHRRWDQWHSVSHLRRLAQSHYCGSCQRSFCKEHTCISSHGAVGSCGLESTCYCHACFGRMPPEVKAALKATNKLGGHHSSPGDGCGGGRSSPTLKQPRCVRASRGSTNGSAAGSSVCSESSGVEEPNELRLAELDSQLVMRRRSEANWAKARTAVGNFLKVRPHGKPPAVPRTPQAADGGGARAVGNSPAARVQRDPSPLRRTSSRTDAAGRQ